MSKPIPKTRFHKFQNRGEIAAWESHLNRRWPYRHQLVRHMAAELREMAPTGETLQVVELASGPGMVAWQLLNQVPQMTYTGLDFSDPFVAYAERRLRRFGTRARFIHADLRQDEWQSDLPQPVDAFVSLQSLHDLGAEEQVHRVYREGFRLLSERGKFVNADFVVPPQRANAKDPGRLSVARHLELLQDIGYKWGDLRARQDDFAFIVAGKS